jgi:hypothetical protein
VIVNIRTPSKVEHVVIAQSTVHLEGYYVVSTTVDIDGLTMIPFVTWFVEKPQRKQELFYFGFVAQWQPFRAAVLSRQMYVHQYSFVTSTIIQQYIARQCTSTRY